MDNMTAGHELLRQKEERLKVMENALLGGLVRKNIQLTHILNLTENYHTKITSS